MSSGSCDPVELEGRLTQLEGRVDTLEVRRQERRAALGELEDDLEGQLDELRQTTLWTRRGVVVLLAKMGGDVGLGIMGGPVDSVAELTRIGMRALGVG